jgi:hypothetical protein
MMRSLDMPRADEHARSGLHTQSGRPRRPAAQAYAGCSIMVQIPLRAGFGHDLA